MTHQLYRAHGLTIASDYTLPMCIGEPACDPDVTVLRGNDQSVPDMDPTDSAPLANVAAPDGRVFYSFTQVGPLVQMRYPGLCLMRADASISRVTVHLHPGADEGLIPVLVSGAVMSLHLVMRGKLGLHASAVESAGGALAFVGTSGMGKSTIAALLGLAGHPLVTDDLLHVDMSSHPGVHVHRGGTESRLRRPAAGLAVGIASRITSDGRTAADLPLSEHLTLPLRACVIPRPSRSSNSVSVQLLSRPLAMTALLGFPRLVGWQEPRRLTEQFDLVADLVSQVPVLVAELPWGPPFDPTVPEQLLSALEVADSRTAP
jgi:hypothetical protein